MVIEYENITQSSIQKQNLNENKRSEIHKNMDKAFSICNGIIVNKSEEDDEASSKHHSYSENEKCNNELLRTSNHSNNWWSNENDGAKLDSRQRWSFGSDISIEATENIQSRLCCSPVDEFDSTVSSENEDLIVNGVDERDESYQNYIQISPACSPTFKKVVCNSDTKKQNKDHDVDTADDELIDYSKRYTTDTSVSLIENKHINSSHIQQQQQSLVNTVSRHVSGKKSTSVNNRSKVDPFGDYAETDLDQPTDYSLRYAEEDTDEEEKENHQFYCAGEQEDTVKTYYTEGTPYQTPCNFSNSTSMSDLLSLEDTREGDDVLYKRQYLKEQKQDAVSDKSVKAVKDSRNRIKRKYISEDPKIPILEESRDVNLQETCERKLEKLSTPPQSPIELSDKDKENKAVTFNVEENYTQKTPLMFSRSSSLDSLSEFEQHSIHDDHSSIISDFSHRTSGAVSPSELPDSPTQTVPPSPGRLKHFDVQQQPQRMPLRLSMKKAVVQRHEGDNKVHLIKSLPEASEQTYEKSKVDQEINRNSVFEDGLVTFKEESIPNKVHSTAASSLSALTIDDEDEEGCDNHEIINKIATLKLKSTPVSMHQAPIQKLQGNDFINESDKLSFQPQFNKILSRYPGYRNNCLLLSPSKEKIHFVNVEEDNNFMDSCVNKELQNNRYRDTNDHWYKSDLKSDNRNHSNRILSRSPVSKRNHQFVCPQKVDIDEIIALDTITIYCTEDTPTYVSPFGSQSNLSALSMLSISDDNLSYNENFQENENLRSFYEEERSSSRLEAYDTDASSDFETSEDDEKCYDEEDSPDTRRRIDVSPFDSQINLANFSLLCIEEVSEEEDEEEEINNETDKSIRDDSCAAKMNVYKRLSYDNSDYSDEDRKVLEECIKSGVSKITRRRDDSDVDEQHLL